MDTSNDQNAQLHMDQGFVRKPYARKKIVVGPDGTRHVVYEDIRTGKIVNPEGYTVIQSDNTIDSTNVTPTQGQTLNKPQTTQNQTNNTQQNVSQDILQSHDASHVATDTAHSQAGASYYNKPGWMGWADFVPGTIGNVAMLGNLGININNTQAVNKQKEALGFTPSTTMQNIGSSLFDRQGYIGDLSTTRPNGTVETAPVSFEAQDVNGRTTYTPDEARMHEILAGSVPATDAQKQTAIGTFGGEFPNQGSFFSSLQNSAKGLFGSIFGGSPKPATGVGSATGPAPNSGVTMDHGFPSAPSAPTSGYGITNSANNSPDDRDQHTTNTTGGYSSPGLY